MARGRIAIIDDDEDNLAYMTEIVEEAGCAAEVFSDGASALATLKSQPPDMVFLDVQMPGMNGFEVLKGIRESDRLSGVPVVLLSGIGAVTGDDYDPDKIEDRYGVRPDSFVSKPIVPRDIQAELNRFLTPA
ncbi:response regulator [Verrucomicrobiota bacterium]